MEPGAPPATVSIGQDLPIDLDAGPDDQHGRWVGTVLAALEPCLLLDGDGRVRALSGSAAELLGTTPAAAQGRPVESVLTLVDFSRRALPVGDPVLALPALRSVVHRVLARGLLRVHLGEAASGPGGVDNPGFAPGAATYDMVSVPVAGGGALAFLLPL